MSSYNIRQNTTKEKMPKDARYMHSIFGATIMIGTVNHQKSLGVKKLIIFALRGIFYIAYFEFVCDWKL
jgi:hypothetical protein